MSNEELAKETGTAVNIETSGDRKDVIEQYLGDTFVGDLETMSEEQLQELLKQEQEKLGLAQVPIIR